MFFSICYLDNKFVAEAEFATRSCGKLEVMHGVTT